MHSIGAQSMNICLRQDVMKLNTTFYVYPGFVAWKVGTKAFYATVVLCRDFTCAQLGLLLILAEYIFYRNWIS